MITPSEFLEHYQVVRQSLAPLRLSRWQLTRLLVAQLVRDMSLTGIALGIIIGVGLVSMVITRLTRRSRSLRQLGIPSAVRPKFSNFWSLDFPKMLQESAKKYQHTPFYLNAFGTEYAVLPSKCFDEVKRLPENQASAFALLREVFHGSWTGAGVQTLELTQTINVELCRAIPFLVRQRQQDCAAAFKAALGECPDWREITLYEKMQNIVVTVNSKAFVGEELGTDPGWLRAISNIPLQVGLPTIILGYLPSLIQYFAKPLLFFPLKITHRKVKAMLKPVLQQDIREYEASADKSLLVHRDQGKVQLTGWLLSRYRGGKDFEVLLQDYISVLFESTPSTASALFHIVCELADDEPLQEELRKELLAQTNDGHLPSKHLNELRKMDSVMRESARIHPFSYLVLYRKLLKPIQFSIGPQLPAGTNICVDAHSINTSPSLWDRPEEFDGLRHYRARQQPENEMRYKFANLGSDAPGWGDGLQACPGRMFADNTMKIILTHLLLNYDVKLRPGESKPEKGAMPNGSVIPGVFTKVLFRSRVPSVNKEECSTG